ncbi:MAG: serine hydrolase [Sediminibacterium sp.]|nr:serine hydrolase [Sediminibacterium sp.]
MKKILKPALLLLLLIPGAAGLYAQFKPAQIKTIDSALTILENKSMFNGVVILADHGKVVYSKVAGYADAGTQQPLTRSASFNLASLTKQFVAMMIMQLKEKQQIQYDHKVQQYFPAFPYPDITIRHLLTHTSGLPEYFELTDRFSNTLDTATNTKILNALNQYKPALHFTPGSRWEYSNTGYVLLASLITEITGQPIEQVFQDKICKPLGMKNSFAYYHYMKGTLLPNQKRVLGFERVNGKNEPNDLIRADGAVGDGNFYSSADDLLKWDQALYTNQLVSASTLQEAFTPVKLNDGKTENYGFGWQINRNGAQVSHTGGWVGFRNSIDRNIDQHTTVIVLSNNSNGRFRKIISDILEGKTPAIPYTQLISNVQIIDGTGVPAVKGAVRIENNIISEKGNLVPFKDEPVTDGQGLVLAPGFIDTHSHHFGGLKSKPEALPTANQGITTIAIGQDGDSYPMDTLAAFFGQRPVAVNVASYTGHSSLRRGAMGAGNLFRTSSAAELDSMKNALTAEMKKGSFGLATGLEYESAFYSNKDEVIELAKVAAQYNGRYISHIRSEDINLHEAVEEIIEIGRQAKIPVQISHIKIAKKSLWKTAPQLLARLQTARAEGVNITADVYPYNFWNSTLKILFPNRDYTNPISAEFAVNQLFDADQSVLIRFAPERSYEGKTIGTIASIRKEKPSVTLMALIAMAAEFDKKYPDYEGSTETIMGKAMDDQDVADFISWPHANICSDGSSSGHPRGHGTFTRILGRYVREQQLMPLETAIYKMTGLSAEHLGIRNRGIIQGGNYADLVLFNPAAVIDRADVKNGTQLSEGIEMVWVNGVLTYQKGKATGKYPGMLIKNNY